MSKEEWRVIKDRPVECRLGNVAIDEENFCEHCGLLEPFDAVFCDGDTWWCQDCIYANGYELTENESQLIEDASDRAKVRHYVKKLEELGFAVDIDI